MGSRRNDRARRVSGIARDIIVFGWVAHCLAGLEKWEAKEERDDHYPRRTTEAFGLESVIWPVRDR